jgi:hypothetical protein
MMTRSTSAREKRGVAVVEEDEVEAAVAAAEEVAEAAVEEASAARSILEAIPE